MAEGEGAAEKGGQKDKGKKMAKKAGPTALQTEVATDDEWAAILERPGLVFVDIYSGWSGPCTGMVSILKKIKMEIGGDSLSYAIAKCDDIAQLARFRNKSEPTWMFVQNGKMVNITFGADSPKLQKLLTQEIKRVIKEKPPSYSIPVSTMSPFEVERNKKIDEARRIEEAEKIAKIEAEIKRKYEDRMEHLLNALKNETILILFPWHFVDEEGNKRDKKQSPAYKELVEQILPNNYSIDHEIRQELDDDMCDTLEKETDLLLSDETRNLLKDGKAMAMHLKWLNRTGSYNIETLMFNLLYDEDEEIPTNPSELRENCFVNRHSPSCGVESGDKSSGQLSGGESANTYSTGEEENMFSLRTVWIPLNSRNRVLALECLFNKYVYKTYPYEEPVEEPPIVLFKFDSTRRKELQLVFDQYNDAVVNFAVFERDKLPQPKKIATSFSQFENEIKEKTGFEAFVVVIKKIGHEAFLSFAGIGPYHVSETPEDAEEEQKQYFPEEEQPLRDISSQSDEMEDEEEEEEYMPEGEEEEDMDLLL